jgi:hypothetical protein
MIFHKRQWNSLLQPVELARHILTLYAGIPLHFLVIRGEIVGLILFNVKNAS